MPADHVDAMGVYESQVVDLVAKLRRKEPEEVISSALGGCEGEHAHEWERLLVVARLVPGRSLLLLSF